jgi:hypothetical protein
MKICIAILFLSLAASAQGKGPTLHQVAVHTKLAGSLHGVASYRARRDRTAIAAKSRGSKWLKKAEQKRTLMSGRVSGHLA